MKHKCVEQSSELYEPENCWLWNSRDSNNKTFKLLQANLWGKKNAGAAYK